MCTGPSRQGGAKEIRRVHLALDEQCAEKCNRVKKKKRAKSRGRKKRMEKKNTWNKVERKYRVCRRERLRLRRYGIQGRLRCCFACFDSYSSLVSSSSSLTTTTTTRQKSRRMRGIGPTANCMENNKRKRPEEAGQRKEENRRSEWTNGSCVRLTSALLFFP